VSAILAANLIAVLIHQKTSSQRRTMPTIPSVHRSRSCRHHRHFVSPLQSSALTVLLPRTGLFSMVNPSNRLSSHSSRPFHLIMKEELTQPSCGCKLRLSNDEVYTNRQFTPDKARTLVPPPRPVRPLASGHPFTPANTLYSQTQRPRLAIVSPHPRVMGGSEGICEEGGEHRGRGWLGLRGAWKCARRWRCRCRR
jgi:hypothetical protein